MSSTCTCGHDLDNHVRGGPSGFLSMSMTTCLSCKCTHFDPESPKKSQFDQLQEAFEAHDISRFFRIVGEQMHALLADSIRHMDHDRPHFDPDLPVGAPDGSLEGIDDREEGAKAMERYIEDLEHEKGILASRLHSAYLMGQDELNAAATARHDLIVAENRNAELEDALQGLVEAIKEGSRRSASVAVSYAQHVLREEQDASH